MSINYNGGTNRDKVVVPQLRRYIRNLSLHAVQLYNIRQACLHAEFSFKGNPIKSELGMAV